MNRKKISPNNPTNKQTKNPRRARPQRSAARPPRYRFLMILCGMFLIAGFFFAARQHFSSIDFSIKNSRLRKMSEELESEKRRLLLSKEIALSPTEIKKAAQKIGFTAMAAGNTAISRLNDVKPVKAQPVKAEAPKSKQPDSNKAPKSAEAEKTPAKKIKEEKISPAKVKKENAQTEK